MAMDYHVAFRMEQAHRVLAAAGGGIGARESNGGFYRLPLPRHWQCLANRDGRCGRASPREPPPVQRDGLIWDARPNARHEGGDASACQRTFCDWDIGTHAVPICADLHARE
ncbi:hypothetical protein ACHAW5_009241 [Stephanodiscus triporus]|uniref:Uncharacterized protein n=1 Tax=Stephanodiscus triporus TaxID=2934178 RepID=A0ABD3NEF4_9STRA